MNSHFDNLRLLQAGQQLKPTGVHCAIVGCDGAGKTFTTTAVAEELQKNGIKPYIFKSFDPSDRIWRPSMITKRLVRDNANQHVGVEHFDQALHTLRFHDQTRLLPDILTTNPVVLCDRYILDRIALIRWDTKVRNSPSEVFLKTLISDNLVPTPDLTFYMRVDPEIAFQRIISRGEQIEEKEKPHNLATTIEHLDELSIDPMFQPVHTLDATLPITDLVQIIIKHILNTTEQKLHLHHSAAMELCTEIITRNR